MGQKGSAQERDLQSIDQVMGVKLMVHSSLTRGPVRSRPLEPLSDLQVLSRRVLFSPALPPNFVVQGGRQGFAACWTTITVPDNQLDAREPQAQPVAESLVAKPGAKWHFALSPSCTGNRTRREKDKNKMLL